MIAATTTDSWNALEASMRELADLSGMAGLLGWDHETYMAPSGAEARARLQATLRVIRHQRLTDDRLGDQLAEMAEAQLDPARAAMVRNLARDRDRAVRLPHEFVRRLALAESRGVDAWRAARAASDFSIFLPHLEEIVAVKRDEADLIGHHGERYDALLDRFEPGMRVARLEPLFATLRLDLRALLDRILAIDEPPPPPFAGRVFPRQGQWDFTLRLLEDIGFDMQAGRQDISAHPFTTTIALGDVRLTTRIHEDAPFDSVFSSIHEGGHGLYEQGFDPAHEGTPVADAASLGIHESQSRLWENVVGRSRPFWEHYTPVMRGFFPEQMRDTSPEDVFREVNRVRPSLIRVEADEVTYNLHVLIRLELELALMRDQLDAAELPAAWNEAYRSTLGISSTDDAEGVLQDIHWSIGLFGYFPTYTLGNLYAALLWDRFRAERPDADELIGAGSFGVLLEWLRVRVHRPGHLHDAEDLVRLVTGQGLSHEPFMRYLTTKFETVYGLAG
jgi:carboxypeptidase Taq